MLLNTVIMKLSEIKNYLAAATSVRFQLPDGSFVPEHFHVTEIGAVTKHFIDCGGTVRTEKVANFQLWDANDYDHRLKPGKLLGIIALSEDVLKLEDLEIEVEYQAGTIGKFDLGFDGANFLLLNKNTACLASDSCGVPAGKNALQVKEQFQNTCTPGGGCC